MDNLKSMTFTIIWNEDEKKWSCLAIPEKIEDDETTLHSYEADSPLGALIGVWSELLERKLG